MSKGGGRRGRSTGKQPFYSFLPPAEARTRRENEMAVNNKFKGEAGERVDLDLKL